MMVPRAESACTFHSFSKLSMLVVSPGAGGRYYPQTRYGPWFVCTITHTRSATSDTSTSVT